MKHVPIHWFFFLLTGLVLSCSKDEENLSPDKYTIKKDIAYGAHPQQKIDLYLPAGRSQEATRTLILIHGGGWTSGDKWEMDVFIDTSLMRKGNYAIVNMNYRLANETQFKHPYQMEDIRKVILFLRDHAADYHIHPGRFALAGASAGGHLALLYDYGYDQEDYVKAVISCAGPTNFAVPEILQDTSQYLSVYGYLGKTHWENLDLWYEASPYHRAGSNSAPTAIFMGEADHIVPLAQGQMMKARLDSLGVPVMYTQYAGAGHGWWPGGPYFPDTQYKILHWLEEYL